MMLPIQGFGWSGVRDCVRSQLGENFNQRVFCKDVIVGDKTHYHFSLPEKRSNDPEKPLQDATWRFDDVTVNAPILPEPFTFVLQGQNSEMQTARYKYDLSGNDIPISRAAMKAERFITQTVDVPNSPLFTYLRDGQMLSPQQVAEIEARYDGKIAVVTGTVTGRSEGPAQKISIRRRMTDSELDEALKVKSSYSQHSSIVCSTYAPRLAMAWDLAIGQNKAFENEKFWDSLLLMADWRRGDLNPVETVRDYYQNGILPVDFKPFMNKSERPHGMPTGEFGVVNDYGPRQRVQPGTKRDMENKMVDVLQWDMPKPQV